MKGYIYRIYCIDNQKSYIGQTIDIKTRYKRHFSRLKNKTHPNEHLQNAFNKYGEDSFTWQQWEFNIQNKEELNQLEKDYITKFNAYTNGFNKTAGGDNPPDNQKISTEYLSYCLCILFEYEGCGHSLEEYFGYSRNVMAPLKRGERGQKAWNLYNTYSEQQKKEYAKKYYYEWGIDKIKASHYSYGSYKASQMTQKEYNECFAAQELGYGYSCVAKYYEIKPATVKDWFTGRSRKKNKQVYDSLSQEEKNLIKSSLPLQEFQELENPVERANRIKQAV